jgi:hypothetical protein
VGGKTPSLRPPNPAGPNPAGPACGTFRGMKPVQEPAHARGGRRRRADGDAPKAPARRRARGSGESRGTERDRRPLSGAEGAQVRESGPKPIGKAGHRPGLAALTERHPGLRVQHDRAETGDRTHQRRGAALTVRTVPR